MKNVLYVLCFYGVVMTLFAGYQMIEMHQEHTLLAGYVKAAEKNREALVTLVTSMTNACFGNSEQDVPARDRGPSDITWRKGD